MLSKNLKIPAIDGGNNNTKIDHRRCSILWQLNEPASRPSCATKYRKRVNKKKRIKKEEEKISSLKLPLLWFGLALICLIDVLQVNFYDFYFLASLVLSFYLWCVGTVRLLGKLPGRFKSIVFEYYFQDRIGFLLHLVSFK